jgi:hypothetical protein
MELSIERLLRPSTPEALMRIIPALQTTALRYAHKRSSANLAAQWLPPAAVAGAAAAAAADVSVGGSGGEAAVLNTRLGKLLGSMRAWWPHSCGADSCRRVRVTFFFYSLLYRQAWGLDGVSVVLYGCMRSGCEGSGWSRKTGLGGVLSTAGQHEGVVAAHLRR